MLRSRLFSGGDALIAPSRFFFFSSNFYENSWRNEIIILVDDLTLLFDRIKNSVPNQFNDRLFLPYLYLFPIIYPLLIYIPV